MKIRFRNYTIYDKRIKDDVRILNISDIHSNYKYLNVLLNKIDKIKPDIITIPGDLFDSVEDKHNNDVINIVNNIQKKVKVIISLGNHDCIRVEGKKHIEADNSELIKKLESMDNVIVLKDDNYIYKDISFNGFNIDINWYLKDKEDVKKYERLLSDRMSSMKIDDEKYNILIQHSSLGLIFDSKLTRSLDGIDLILCGHTHAGVTPEFIQKISKNNVGLVGLHHNYFMKGAYGYYKNQNTSLIISNGLTKMGKSHMINPFRTIGNLILGLDGDIIDIKSGKDIDIKLSSIKKI